MYQTHPRTHVHFGAGKIGLAFTLFFANHCHFRSILINRKGGSTLTQKTRALLENRAYIVRYFGDSACDSITIHDMLMSDTTEDKHRILDIIANPDTALITTAVGESRLGDIAPLIADGLVKRGSNGAKLFIIACENGRKCSTQLRYCVCDHLPDHKLSTANVSFVDCLVDQICPNDPEPEEDGTVCIQAEPYREWVIGSADDGIKGLMGKHNDILFVSPNTIDFYEKRKLWMVNGFFLGLALYGYIKGNRINEWIKETRKEVTGDDLLLSDVLAFSKAQKDSFAWGLLAELATAVHLYQPEKLAEMKVTNPFKVDDLIGYMQKVENRVSASPDTCIRMLRELLISEEKVQALMKDFLKGLEIGQTLKARLARHLEDAVYAFIGKFADRLNDPLEVLAIQGREHHNLLSTVQSSISLLRSQRTILSVKDGDSLR